MRARANIRRKVTEEETTNQRACPLTKRNDVERKDYVLNIGYQDIRLRHIENSSMLPEENS